jgi:hypothetical protein
MNIDRKSAIEAVNKLYKITLFFPKKEPLRYKIRDVATDILACIIAWEDTRASRQESAKEALFETDKNLDILKGFLAIAKWQNWASYFDINKVEEDFDKIKKDLLVEIEKIASDEKLSESQVKIEFKNPELTNDYFDPRKAKILEILKEKGRLQVWEANKAFPKITKRTIRRDFEKLLKEGLIERIGERNNTFYQLKLK